MDKMRMESVDMTARNIEKIGALFPNCITETKDETGKPKKAINFDLLRQMLSDDVIEGDEAYEFTWVGKKVAIVEANKPIRKTLRPCKEESVNWDSTENLYIEGNNLEVLKLLQESYLGKVKMIYIDPPYNTGNDFIYRDDFKQSVQDYEDDLGVYDADGSRMFKNTDSNGRFHSDWCSMIYSRLMLARNLLTDDGVIFISIDDNEVFNLKEICDEVFGAGNFVAQLAVQLNPRGRNLDRYVAKTHESVLIYVRDYLNTSCISGVEKEGRMIEEYNKRDERGAYRLIGLRNRNQAFNPTTRPNLYYPLFVNPKTKTVSTERSEFFTDIVWPDTPDGTKTCWTWMKAKVENENGLVTAEKTGDEWRMYLKDYLVSEDGTMATTLVKSLWTENIINNDYGKKTIKELFGKNIMSFPKPPELIKKMIAIGSQSDSTIIDFFSGSATTAHAVMQMNAEDNGHRKFIMIQLPEETEEKSDAYKAGYFNISAIGKERIRRAVKKITEEHPDAKFDGGFRVLKLDDTNMKDVYYAPADYEQNVLDLLESNIKEDRTDLDLLFGCLLEWGLPLALPYKSENIEGCIVHNYNDGDLIACFDENVPESVIKTIAEMQPLRAVFRDSSFASSPEKINVTEIFKRLAPDTSVKVL